MTQSFGPEARGGACSADVVLSDLIMPEMSGMELYLDIVKRDPPLARRRHCPPSKPGWPAGFDVSIPTNRRSLDRARSADPR